MKAQTLIAVSDVEASSCWYQQVLGAGSGHGGADYEQIVCDGEVVLQLHRIDEEHHHGTFAHASTPLGNGVLLWFRTTDLEAAVSRLPSDVVVVTDVHDNPNAGHREIWLQDLDGYLVVLAG